MATLDRDAIKEAARGAVDALKRHTDEQAETELTSLRGEVERLVETLQQQYGHTRTSAKQEIAGFLEELEAIDPALPDIVAEAAAEMSHTRSRKGVMTVLGLLLAVVAVVVFLRFSGPELRTLRSS